MATPSGNAVKGASTRPVRYPVQLVIMVTQAMGDRVTADAERDEVPRSQAARRLLELGVLLADVNRGGDQDGPPSIGKLLTARDAVH